jgi:ribosomal protein L40E
MAKVYVHLSGKDVDNAILAMHGKREKPEVNESKMVQIKCKRCMEINPIGASFCTRCGAPLSVEAMLEMDNGRKVGDDIIAKLWADEEVKKLIAQKINLIFRIPRALGTGMKGI